MAREIQVASAVAERVHLQDLAPELAARAVLHVALQLGASRFHASLDVVLGHAPRPEISFELSQVHLDHPRAGESLVVASPQPQAAAKPEEREGVDGHVGGVDLCLRADAELSNPQVQRHAEHIERGVVEESLDLDQRRPRPSQQPNHARRIFGAQPGSADEILAIQPERRALGVGIPLQHLLHIVSERVEASRRGPVVFAKIHQVGLFYVHSPREPVSELVDGFLALVAGGTVDDAASRLVVEPKNERAMHVQLPLEKVFAQVVPERRRELPRHGVHDARHAIGDGQLGAFDEVPPDVAEEFQNRLRLSIRLLLRVAQSFPPKFVAAAFPVHERTEEVVRVPSRVR